MQRRAGCEGRVRTRNSFERSNYSYLYINSSVVGSAHSIRIGYKEDLLDPVSGGRGATATWESKSTGTHGRRGARFVLQTSVEHLDEPLVAYLRVNEPDYGGP